MFASGMNWQNNLENHLTNSKHDRDFLAACNIRDFAFDKQNMIGQGLLESNTLVETDGCVSH